MFLNEIQIRHSISELFLDSNQVDCAVAFVGEKAIDFIKNDCKVRLICNLESGATNPNAIKQLIEKNVQVKTLKNLHAKVYIGDNCTIIGSANLSANGLSFEGNEIFGWIEAGFKVGKSQGHENIKKWWKELWEKSIEVEETDLEKYVERWSKRRNIRPTEVNEQSILKILTNNPERIKDREIYIVIYTQNYLSDEAQQTLDDIKNNNKYGINVEAYEGWEQLPENAYLIDFYVGPRGGVYYQGIYKSPDKRIIINFPNSDGEEETLFLCYEEKNVMDCTLSPNDIERMKPVIQKILKSERIGVGDQNGKFINIMDIRELLKS